MHVFRHLGQCGMAIGAGLLWASAALAQPAPAPASAGPGRIICQAANKCQLDVGTPPTNMRSKIDASSLADPDKDRLVKQCTAKGAACIATVTGVETKGVIKAAAIKFFN